MANRPSPEIDVTVELASELVNDQFPALGGLALQDLSRGWDNTNYRLGDDHIVRIPHRQAAAQLVLHEQQCLPSIAERVDLPISAPTHLGMPSDTFGWHWSITPWFEGTEAASAAQVHGESTAQALGTFLCQLHTPAPDDAPPNPYRAARSLDRSASFLDRLAALTHRESGAIRSIFDQACAVPATTEHVWLHGDLHTRNVIVDDGQLAAVIDWGDICAGDRATDLAGAYMLVPDHISIVQEHAGATEADWDRARGWAINFAVIYLAHSDDDPVMGAIGTRLLTALGV